MKSLETTLNEALFNKKNLDNNPLRKLENTGNFKKYLELLFKDKDVGNHIVVYKINTENSPIITLFPEDDTTKEIIKSVENNDNIDKKFYDYNYKTKNKNSILFLLFQKFTKTPKVEVLIRNENSIADPFDDECKIIKVIPVPKDYYNLDKIMNDLI